MSPYLKAKLSLAALCVMAIGGSQLYLKGVDDGIARIDQEAFDSYAHFAKQMKHEAHKAAKAPADTTVWAALALKGSK